MDGRGLVKTPFDAITYRVIGACMDVHNALGTGHREMVYQKALEPALRERGLSYVPQRQVELYYRGVSVGLSYIDFVVEECVVLEIKAVSGLSIADTNQVLAYLAATGCPVGLLVNFGERRLVYRRLFPPTKIVDADAPSP